MNLMNSRYEVELGNEKNKVRPERGGPALQQEVLTPC
jgi:hypothetical protein